MSEYSNRSRDVAVYRVPPNVLYILQLAIDVLVARRLSDSEGYVVGLCLSRQHALETSRSLMPSSGSYIVNGEACLGRCGLCTSDLGRAAYAGMAGLHARPWIRFISACISDRLHRAHSSKYNTLNR
jgi:hypothetical protein